MLPIDANRGLYARGLRKIMTIVQTCDTRPGHAAVFHTIALDDPRASIFLWLTIGSLHHDDAVICMRLSPSEA